VAQGVGAGAIAAGVEPHGNRPGAGGHLGAGFGLMNLIGGVGAIFSKVFSATSPIG
jgi:hypothetical protein